MSSFYVTYPGDENHSTKLDGKRIIKVGIFKGVGNGQKYVNRRYMASPILKCGHRPSVDFYKMHEIERNVLDCLVRWGYIKQPTKKEHFIISDDEESEFVDDVVRAYNHYILI